MKKFFALILAVAMLATMTACGGEKKPDGETAETLKFGFGVSVKGAVNNDKGEGSLDVTYAAVLVDADGKIVDAKLDAVNMTTKLNEGALQLLADKKDLTSKREQGDAYNMVNWGKGQAIDGGDVKLEWYKQADAFLSLVPGKTADEVVGMVVNDYRGNDEVIAAGCTIGINDFADAISNACANAKAEVAADAKLSVSVVGSEKEKDGVITFTADVAGAAKDANGKILAITSDCATFDYAVDTEGVISLKDLQKEEHAKMSKRQMGDDYMMKNWDTGTQSTWTQQADAFNEQCIGKTAAEIAGLEKEDGKGADAVYNAGCTITVSGLVAAASKL